MLRSVAEQILDELLPSFELLETRSEALLQFLTDKKITTDEQLAPYMEQARSASAIRWNAVRLRMNHLLAPAFEASEQSIEERPSEASTKPAEEKRDGSANSDKEHKKQTSGTGESTSESKKDVAAARDRTGEHGFLRRSGSFTTTNFVFADQAKIKSGYRPRKGLGVSLQAPALLHWTLREDAFG